MITLQDIPHLYLVNRKVENNEELTALELYIYHHQPREDGAAYIWLCDLGDMLREATK